MLHWRRVVYEVFNGVQFIELLLRSKSRDPLLLIDIEYHVVALHCSIASRRLLLLGHQHGTTVWLFLKACQTLFVSLPVLSDRVVLHVIVLFVDGLLVGLNKSNIRLL